MNDRPFHIQSIKTKFLDATLKDATIGTSGGMVDATNPIKVQWEVNAQKVSEQRLWLEWETHPESSMLKPTLCREQDFFRKLKFKYLEQEAKLEFTQAITGETPKILGRGENDQLEATNSMKKAELKRFKADLEALTTDNEVLGKTVSACESLSGV